MIPLSGKPETEIKPGCNPGYSNPPPPPYAAKHPTSLVISLGIAGAALLLLSYFAMRRYALRRRSSPPPPPPFMRYNNREDFTDGLRGPAIDHPVWYIRTVGLPQSTVDSIHRFIYKKGDGLIETSDCSVCLSNFDDGDSLRLLPKCSHAFHVACIDTWLRSHTNCPLCRAPILGTGGGQPGAVESGSSSSLISVSGESSNRVGISDRAMIGQEMEPMRRSVSLDFSSALSNDEVKKRFWRVRSMSLSGPSIPV